MAARNGSHPQGGDEAARASPKRPPAFVAGPEQQKQRAAQLEQKLAATHRLHQIYQAYNSNIILPQRPYSATIGSTSVADQDSVTPKRASSARTLRASTAQQRLAGDSQSQVPGSRSAGRTRSAQGRPPQASPFRPLSGRLSAQSRGSSSSLKAQTLPAGALSGMRRNLRRASRDRLVPKTQSLTAYVNGKLEGGAKVVGRKRLRLLEEATRKLDLPFAAQRIFDEDGNELLTDQDCMGLERDEIVYVSTGETFIDPFDAQAKRIERLRSAGGSNEASLASFDASTPPLSAPLKYNVSKRIQAISGRQRARVFVFQNGNGQDPTHVLFSEERDKFLDAATSKLGLHKLATRMFDLHGHEIRAALAEDDLEHKRLWPVLGRVLGPVCVSSGEAFDAYAAAEVVKSLKRQAEEKLQKIAASSRRLSATSSSWSNQSSDESSDSETAETEVWQRRTLVQDCIDELTSVLRQLEKQISAGMNRSMVDVKEIPADHNLLTPGATRFFCLRNGQSRDMVKPASVVLNLQSLYRQAATASTSPMELLLESCTSAIGTAAGANAKFLYNQQGEKIDDISKISKDDLVFVSFGEPFASRQHLSLALQLQTVCFRHDERGKVQTYVDSLVDSASLHADQLTPLNGQPASIDENQEWSFSPADQEPLDVSSGALLSMETGPKGGGSNSAVFACLAVDFLGTNRKALFETFLIDQEAKGNCVKVRTKYKFSLVMACLPQSVHVDLSGHVVHDGERSASFETGASNQLQGVAVGLAHDANHDSRRWVFHKDGTISCSERGASLVLTLLHGDDGHESPRASSGHGFAFSTTASRPVLALLPKQSGRSKLGRLQRWGVRQRDMVDVGQWKLSRCINRSREWTAAALSWPFNQHDQPNREMMWPVEGCLVAEAPWTHAKEGKQEPVRRVRVCKIGQEESEAVWVVLPGSNAVHASSPRSSKADHQPTGHRSRSKHGVSHRSEASIPIDTRKWIEQRRRLQRQQDKKAGRTSTLPKSKRLTAPEPMDKNLQIFLDRCTEALHLSNAARAVFTIDGRRLDSLRNLNSQQILYISTGEPWKPSPVLEEAVPYFESELEKLRLYRSMAFQRPMWLEAGQDGAVRLSPQSEPEETKQQWKLLPTRQVISVAQPSLALTAQGTQAACLTEINDKDSDQKWVFHDKTIQTSLNHDLVITASGLGSDATHVKLDRSTSDAMHVLQVFERVPLPSGPRAVNEILRRGSADSSEASGPDQTPFQIRAFAAPATDLKRAAGLIAIKAVASPGSSKSAPGVLAAAVLLSTYQSLGIQAEEVGKRLAFTAIRTVEQCDDAIKHMEHLLARLNEDHAALSTIRAPTSSLDTLAAVRVLFHQNGTLDERSSAVLPLLEDFKMDTVLARATRKLELSMSARKLFTKTGKEVKSIAVWLSRQRKDGVEHPELWVSCGEPFQPLEQLPDYIKQQIRDLKAEMQSCQQQAGVLQGQLSSGRLSGAELDLTKIELKETQEKLQSFRDKISQLRQKESELRRGRGAADVATKLDHSIGDRLAIPTKYSVRVLAYPNGDNRQAPKLCIGTSLELLKDSCSRILSMRARKLYTEDGTLIRKIEDIKRDMIVFVSSGEPFIDIYGHAKRREQKKDEAPASQPEL